MKKENRRLFLILCAVPILLLIPYGFMQFTNEVNWSPFDFLIAGFLLLSVGLICELILRKAKSKTNKLYLLASVLFLLVLIWAELAVGIFGSPISGN